MYFYTTRLSSLSSEEQEKCCLHNFAPIHLSNSMLCTHWTDHWTDLSVVEQAKKTCWSVFQCPGTSSSFLSGFPRLHLGEGPRPPGISPSSRGAQRSARPGSPGWLISFMKSLSWRHHTFNVEQFHAFHCYPVITDEWSEDCAQEDCKIPALIMICLADLNTLRQPNQIKPGS